MKVGFQTIVWGQRFTSIEYALDVISAAGYEGVEFMQRLETLGNINSLMKLLNDRGMELIGLTGDSLDERMKFCGDYRPEYLYVDSWDDEEARKAMDKGFTLGIHPHFYMPIQSYMDAYALLEKYPADQYPLVRFIPDTAHLTVAHDDPLEVIQKTATRIVAVHLKDWSPGFGRSQRLYAKGFVKMGSGCVKLDEIVKYLIDSRFGQWVVVERDYTRTNPAKSTLANARWLADRGVLKTTPREVSVPHMVPLDWANARDPREVQRESRFLEAIARANIKNLSACYLTIVKAFADLTQCDLVQLWICNSAEGVMNLLAVRALVDVPVDYVLVDYKHCLSGTTIARQRVMRFNLDDPDDPSAAERSEIPLSLVAHTMISIPLVSPWNPRHVRYVVNLFFTDEAEVTISDNDLARYGECAAIAMESSMSDLCSSTSAEVNLVASRSKRVKDFLEAMVAIVKDSLECEGVAIFTVNNTGKKLELKATTGTHWTVPTGEQFYLKGEGLTGGVWASGKTLITPNAHCEKGWLGKSLEGDESRSRDAHLGVPLTKPNGETIGVIRVRNRVYHRTLGTTVFCSFADDDAEVLENIAQAAIPHLELLLSQDRRVKAVGKLTHELKVPIVAIRGAVDLMKSSKGIRAILTHDYLGDILSWTDLMMGLLNNLDLIQYSSLRIPIHPRKTRFLADVVAPAVRQMKPVLRAKGLDPARITRRGTAQVPPMWIDPSRFQQVIFNLISNAVKYSYDDPDAFRVDIYGFSDNRGIIIRCDDYGIGINPGEEAMIFEEGYRGTGAIEKDVTGHGLGLWVVRRIVEMHDGQIEVTNNRYPTQFTISLPTYLTHRPASPQDKELL